MRRRLFALALTGVLSVMSLTGCGNDTVAAVSEAQDEAEVAEADTAATETTEASSQYQTTYGEKQFDNVTITVELFDRSNAPEGSTLLDNKWVEYVNEQMGKVGITVEFVAVPRSDEVTKMQTMMASGTAPDLTLTYNYSMAQDYYKQGGTWDLSPFIDGEGQAKNLHAYIADDVLDIGRLPDGALTGIVAKRATTAQSNMFLRKDWLDEQNIAIPTTPDELYDAMVKIHDKHPEAVSYFWGLNDGANSVCYRNNLEMAFSQLVGDEKQLMIAQGIDYYYDPGTREYFRFANRCYNDGLIEPEYYASTTDTYNSDIVTGKTNFYESNVNYSVDILRGSLLKTLQENVEGADIVSIPALKNVNDGQQYSSAYALGGLIAFCPLTASEETVEACMTYLDWQCTHDGGHVLYHGFEDEHYVLNENGVEIVKDADYNATDKDWLRTDIFLVGNQGYFDSVDKFNACSAAENPGYEQYVLDNYENSLTGTVVPNSSYTSPSQTELSADLQILGADWIVKCVTGSVEDFDKNYDDFMKACEDAGIQKIVDERTEYYDSVYGK